MENPSADYLEYNRNITVMQLNMATQELWLFWSLLWAENVITKRILSQALNDIKGFFVEDFYLTWMLSIAHCFMT